MSGDIQSFLDEIEERDGVYVGAMRKPINSAIKIVGSIHDDNMASRLGLRGGTVAGSIHLELFPPLLLKAFGQRWFERGNVSIYFLDPTTDREEVRAMLKVPASSDAQVEAWAERPDGRRIGEGTAAAGDSKEPSALSARDISRYPPGELRILADCAVGDSFPEVEARVTPDMQKHRLELTTDPLPWCSGDSPWGGPIATPCHLVDMMRPAPERYLRERIRAEAVPLYGAIEVGYINGPVFVDKPYVTGGRIMSLGQSPRTEYLWFDSYVIDADGLPVAQMRMQYRFMKASASLSQDN